MLHVSCLVLFGLSERITSLLVILHFYIIITLLLLGYVLSGVPFTNIINFNPRMDKWLQPLKVWSKIIYPFPNFNGVAVEVWGWINNFISHFTGYVITYAYWDLSWSILVKGALDFISKHLSTAMLQGTCDLSSSPCYGTGTLSCHESVPSGWHYCNCKFGWTGRRCESGEYHGPVICIAIHNKSPFVRRKLLW